MILGARPFLPPVLSQTPAALHYPAVFLAAWIGGLWPGLVSTAICTVYSSVYLRPHLMSAPWHDTPGLIRSFMFIYTSVFFTVLVSGLQRAWLRAEDAIQSRDEFLSLASHELRTPITGLLLHMQLRQRRSELQPDKALTGEELRQMVKSDLRQIQRLNQLVDSMLDVSRLRSGQAPFHPVEIDLCTITQEFVTRFKEQRPGEAELLSLKLCEPAIGSFDPMQIEQILANLVGNSFKYAGQRPVAVSVVRVGSTDAELRVKDEGPGIRPEEQEKIFRKFERLSSHRHLGGLGLGLHISQELAARHGGSIRVESEPGQGALFVVKLPLRKHLT